MIGKSLIAQYLMRDQNPANIDIVHVVIFNIYTTLHIGVIHDIALVKIEMLDKLDKLMANSMIYAMALLQKE
jgi:hypothetical protein